ncbi:hypothetical protein [Martelella mangrovi]|uniref:DUF904 domain-containing protein n=1 Tax=Martelella mangrovi TaxID=1397477 RepID=A0ABV2IG40_9HYPH
MTKNLTQQNWSLQADNASLRQEQAELQLSMKTLEMTYTKRLAETEALLKVKEAVNSEEDEPVPRAIARALDGLRER